MPINTERAVELLRQNGLRATLHARSVLGVLDRLGKPVTVKTIYEAFPGRPCDLATIHRILAKCERAGLVRGTRLHGKSKRFERVVAGSHHHHLICTQCEKIQPLSVCEIEKIQHRVRRDTGFRVTAHALELFGLCRECHSKKEPS